MTPAQTRAWERRVSKVLKAPVRITFDLSRQAYRFKAEGFPSEVFIGRDAMATWAKITGDQLTRVAHRIAAEFRA